MQTFIFSNTKGGVSKTHLSYHFAKTLSERGVKVLCIDLDQQSHLVKLLRTPEAVELSKVIIRDMPIEQAISKVEDNLWCLYSDISLRNINGYLLSIDMGRETVLARKLKSVIDNFDIVVVDLPPSIDATVLNSFMLPNAHVVVPVTLNHLALDGLSKISDTIEDIQKYLNSSVQLHRIVICRDNVEISRHSHSCRQILEEDYSKELCKSNFPHSIHFVNAALHGLSIRRYIEEHNIQKAEHLIDSLNNTIDQILV